MFFFLVKLLVFRNDLRTTTAYSSDGHYVGCFVFVFTLFAVVAGRKKIKTLTHGLFCLVSIGLALRKLLTQLFVFLLVLRRLLRKDLLTGLFTLIFSTRTVCLLSLCFGFVSMLDSDKRSKQNDV